MWESLHTMNSKDSAMVSNGEDNRGVYIHQIRLFSKHETVMEYLGMV